MSQVVTELVIDSDTSGADRFSQSMDKAGASAQQGINSAAGLTLAIAGVGVAFIGALAGLRSFFDYVGQQNKQLIDIAENARNAGMSAREFQETLFAARSKGLTEKDFVSGLDKITTSLTEASSGVTKFGRLFEANSLSIKNQNGELKNSKQALADIAGLMQGATPVIQQGIAKIVGISKDWIPFLRDGADAIEKQKKAASDLGIIINDDVIEKAKVFDAQWKTAIATWDLQFKASLADILPLMVKLANLASDAISGVGSITATISRHYTPDDEKTKAQLNDQINQVAQLRDLMESLNEKSGEIAKLRVANLASLVGLGGDATVKDVDALLTKLSALYDKKPTAITVGAVGSTVLPPNENKDALDREIDRLQKHIAVTKADTESVGQSEAARAGLRAEATLYAAAERAGFTDLEKFADKFMRIREEVESSTAALQKAKAEGDAKFNFQTLGLSDTEKQIATIQRQLHGDDWKNWMNDGLSSSIRLTENLKLVSDGLKDIGKAAFSAALQGKFGMDQLVGTLDAVAKKLSDKAFDNLLSGNPDQMVIGAAQAGASALISAFTKDEKNSQALKKAQEEWKKAGPEFQKFLTQMSGGVTGNLSQSIQDAAAREASFEDQAWKARDTAAINAARAGITKFTQTQKEIFNATFDAMLSGLNDGLGLDSPFMKGVQNIRTALNAQLAFIDDTDVARGGKAVEIAKQASQSYLLSMLQQPKALSAVQTEMMRIQGTANALQGALVQLGATQAQAADEINKGVTAAIANLKKQFEGGLTERLNTANGQSFLNDATKLIQQHQLDLLDAASLGTDPTIVAAVFHAEAQKIVNDAGLVGDAFASFTKQFPDLAGVVVEATSDIAASAKQLQDAANTTAKNITDYLNNLVSGPGSTSSPIQTLNSAGSVYNANLALAIGGNPDAQSKFPQLADNLEKAARAVYASAQGYQDIKSQIISQGLALPAVQNVTDPVVVAIRDTITAINAAAATQALDATLSNVIKSAIDAGNATQVAIALAPKFSTLSTMTFADFLEVLGPSNAGLATGAQVSSLLTNTQLRAAGVPVSGPLTDAQIRQLGLSLEQGNALNIFRELDNNGNGILEKSEVIASATGTSSYLAGITNYVATSTRDSVNATAEQASQTKDRVGTGNTTLDAIKGLQTTANTQLTLLNNALNPSVNPTSLTYTTQGAFTSSPTLDHAAANVQMLTVLHKIAINTWATAGNTGRLLGGANARDGTLAAGGLVRGPGTGTSDSIPLWLSNREFVIKNAAVERFGVGFFEQLNAGMLPPVFNDNRPISVAAPVFRGGGGDNGNSAALLAEIRALRAELAEVKKTIVAGDNMNAKATMQSGGEIVDAIETDTQKTTEQMRMNKRNQRTA